MGWGWRWGHSWVWKSVLCGCLRSHGCCGEGQPYPIPARILTEELLPSHRTPSTEFSPPPRVLVTARTLYFFPNLEFPNLPVNDPGEPSYRSSFREL